MVTSYLRSPASQFPLLLMSGHAIPAPKPVID